MPLQLPQTFYADCIPQDVLATVLASFESSELSTVTAQLQVLFDVVALRTILTHLPTDAEKIAFLEIYRDEYASSSPLDWAVLKIDNIHIRLQEALERSLLALYQKLQQVS